MFDFKHVESLKLSHVHRPCCVFFVRSRNTGTHSGPGERGGAAPETERPEFAQGEHHRVDCAVIFFVVDASEITNRIFR